MNGFVNKVLNKFNVTLKSSGDETSYRPQESPSHFIAKV